MYLKKKHFKCLVKHGVLFSIDLIVLDGKQRILVGERKNRPAQGHWFVPGGRVYKNERLDEAFDRISRSEIGKAFNYEKAVSLGVYEHFYDDSIFGDDISTHYINTPYLITLNESKELVLPFEQHKKYRWVSIDEFYYDESIHEYSKVFLTKLNSLLMPSKLL